MEVKVQIVAGNDRREPNKNDIQKSIDALFRCIERDPSQADSILIMDTISILEAIREQVPGFGWEL